MGAIMVIRWQTGRPAEGQPDQEVSAGLGLMAGRAPGPLEPSYTGPGISLGSRQGLCLGAAPWSETSSARRTVGGQTLALVVSGFIDNIQEAAAALGTTLAECGGSVANALLLAYTQKGKDFVRLFGGSFAMAVWDGTTRELHLVRDRLGIEPLYHWSGPCGQTVAASEPKAIIRDPRFPRVFNETAIPDLLNSTSRVPGTTVYRDLGEVRPGEVLTFGENRRQGHRYWTLPIHLDTGAKPEETATRVRSSLRDAVKRRLNTRETAGFFLSGGLDSSILCAVARDLTGQDSGLPTFSFAYPDEETGFQADALHSTPDGPYVETMKRYLRSRHEKIVLGPKDFRRALASTVRARDLPGVGDLDVTFLWLFQALAQGGQRVMFSGEGADDLFGGFPWFRAEAEAPSGSFPWLKGTGASGFLRRDLTDKFDFDQTLRDRWTAAEAEWSVGDLPAGRRHMTRVFGIGLTRFLPFLLDRVDRMGAAAGLRTHLPFLDHRFVEEVWDLDYNLKCAQGIEKDLLRKAFTGWLPPEIIHRRKSGFAVVKNPAYTGEVVGYLGELLARRSEEPLFQIVDPDRLSAVLAGTGWADGTFSAPPILPRLVMLDLWMKEYSVRFDPIGPFSA